MEIYITVSFWVGVIGLLARGLLMCASMSNGGSRTSETTIGEDFLLGFISVGFLAWAGFLLYA